MKLTSLALLLSSLPVATIAAPPTSPDQIPEAFRAAWNQHDGHALAETMADDVDFVNVGAVMLHGRADFETFHTRLLSGRFADAIATVLETNVRLLRPDLALIHWTWSMAGDKNVDGSARPKRFGLMTIVAEKRHDAWFVVAAQNTNLTPGAPGTPEMSGLKPVMVIPQ